MDYKEIRARLHQSFSSEMHAILQESLNEIDDKLRKLEQNATVDLAHSIKGIFQMIYIEHVHTHVTTKNGRLKGELFDGLIEPH